MWRHSEKAAVYKPRREASEETNTANSLISNFQPPEPWERNVCCLSHPVPWYFVMEALVNEHSCLYFSSIPNLPFSSTYFTQVFHTVPPKVLLSMSQITLTLVPDGQSTCYLIYLITDLLPLSSFGSYVTTLAWFSSNPSDFSLSPLHVGMSYFLDLFFFLLYIHLPHLWFHPFK